MRELEQFLLELGGGFCFLARQKRIIIDDEDFHLDLLFFHRDLNRLVVIDLKLGDFKPEHKGQMELYLRWLNKHEKRPGEESPMGLILCAGKKGERIELLELDRSGIHVAEYLTVLPPKKILQEKLHKAIAHARKRLEHQPKAQMKKNSGLAEAKAILEDLKNEIQKIEKIALEYNSETEWSKRKARHWLHGATETDEALKLEKWLFANPPPTQTSQIKATKAIRAWRKWLTEKGPLGAYYVDFKDFKISSPKNDETLDKDTVMGILAE